MIIIILIIITIISSIGVISTSIVIRWDGEPMYNDGNYNRMDNNKEYKDIKEDITLSKWRIGSN